MSNYAPAVDHAVRVFEVLANEKEPIGLSEICRRLDLNKNMVFRILNSLEQAGWVYADNTADKKYRMTLLPFQLSSKAAGRLSLNEVGASYVYDLWKKTGETTYLAIPYKNKIMYIQHFEGTADVRVGGVPGGTYDMYCSAPGKAYLAFSAPDLIEEYLKNDLKQRTPNTITEREDLERELKEIRKNGYAVDNEEFSKGILCVSAPVLDYMGNVLGAVGCSMPTAYYDMNKVLQEIKPVVVQTANQISACLGHVTGEKGE